MHICPMAKKKTENLSEIVSWGFSEFQISHEFLTFKNYPYLLEKFLYGIFQCYLISVVHFVSFQKCIVLCNQYYVTKIILF